MYRLSKANCCNFVRKTKRCHEMVHDTIQKPEGFDEDGVEVEFRPSHWSCSRSRSR